MTKLRWWGAGLAVLLVLGGGWWLLGRNGHTKNQTAQEVKPYYGSIQITVSATGTVQPYNRLELKPPIAGRVDQMLVEEGDKVHRGQTLAWMSSSERASLLDAARAEGEKAYQEWADVYKPAPVVSPIDGTVIVRSVLPGQTVGATDDIYVISDRLIVMAQVDETDIGKLHVGQTALLTLDAYPNLHVPARVDHIEYESKVVNNVTIYEVDILPVNIPSEFRSGMSADAEITVSAKEHALLVPKEAVRQGTHKSFVLVSQGAGSKPENRPVEVGLTNDKVAEIVSGVTAEDTLVIEPTDFSLLRGTTNKTNPFMPSRPGGGGGRGH
jgi:membrane fusion protein, macrolide-specific efflux system